MSYGYTGKILHVNLSKSELEIEEPNEQFYRTYMGVVRWECTIFLKETPVGVDPFSPDNVLALCTGILTGTPISGKVA
ncbi:MAG: hypothetical protein Ct9H300mP28_23960 [Pseudomonadota bacterium]|nr:MAG: hypothetical protein Ct9H300mP28_23960 [Pseudomonadota bacterium]